LGGGCTAHLSATAAALSESRFDIDIFGSDGELHFDLRGKLKASYLENIGDIQTVEVTGVTEEERRNAVSIFKGSFVYFAPRIVEAITSEDLSNVADACTFLDAVKTQEVLDALLKSAAEGSSVRMDKGYITRAAI
jgi:predicted dehydrogenase